MLRCLKPDQFVEKVAEMEGTSGGAGATATGAGAGAGAEPGAGAAWADVMTCGTQMGPGGVRLRRWAARSPAAGQAPVEAGRTAAASPWARRRRRAGEG